MSNQRTNIRQSVNAVSRRINPTFTKKEIVSGLVKGGYSEDNANNLFELIKDNKTFKTRKGEK